MIGTQGVTHSADFKTFCSSSAIISEEKLLARSDKALWNSDILAEL